MKKPLLLLFLVVLVACWTTSAGADDQRKCSNNEFQCADGNQCIPSSWRCDGDEDCADSSDEKACDSNDSSASPTDVAVPCLDNEFPCTDGKSCIHRSWWCDGDEDCADASDEKFCNSKNLTQTTTVPAALPTTEATTMATTVKTQGPTVDPSCQRIGSQIRNVCSRLGYAYTRLPNRFGHTNQDQVIQALGGWSEAISKQCSPLLEDFLCRMYVPPCEQKDQTKTPCRVICNSVKRSCRRVLRKLKTRWPSSLRCSKLPKKRCSRLSAKKPTTPPATVRRPSRARVTKGSSKAGVCEKLTISMCQGLHYNQTMYPNSFKDRNQAEAELEVNQFLPLIKAGCHKDFRMFLCSLYAPICTVIEVPIPPCRSMCEQSRKGCEPMMNKFGFLWPEKLNCSNFPEFGMDICIGVSSNSKTDVVTPTTQLTTQPTKKISSPPPRRVCAEKITVPMCKGIGYNYTRMPNILNHNTQAEAALEVHQFWPLVEIGCSSSFRKFLCSVYAPRCTATGGTMLPCRSLCEESKRGCESLMRKYDFAWPTSLNCSSFPVEGDDRSCIAPDARPASEATGTTTKIPPSTTTLGRVEAARASKCEKITIPLCKGLSYNYTMYPNRLGHRTQDEAGLEVHQFFPLVKVDCSSSFSLLLCTVYAPKCSDTLIPPCRSLCERSRKGCQKLTVTFGFSWPASLNCSLFPVEGGTTKCIPPETDITTTARPTVATVTLPPKKYRTVLTKIKGVFTSPNYPNPYPQGIESNWIIQLPDWYKAVKITIRNMRLEEDRNCLYDYILIKDKMLNQVGPRHCGTYRNPYQVLVRGDKAIITFVSDGSTSKAGFVIKYKGLLDYS